MRIQSVDHHAAGATTGLDLSRLPSSPSPEMAAALVRLITRAEAVGLAPVGGEIDQHRLATVSKALNAAGIGTRAVFMQADPQAAVELLSGELAESPVPGSTWPHLVDLLGLEELAAMLRLSVSSVRRYASDERVTPDDVAGRLHTLAMVVADLAGSYNPYGIRRWLSRPRKALDGQTPGEVLRASRSTVDDTGERRVRDLAATLTAPFAS